MLKLVTMAQAYAAHSWYALRDREEGQTMAEYGVILAVITVGIIAALVLLSDGIRDAITSVVSRLRGSSTSTSTP